MGPSKLSFYNFLSKLLKVRSAMFKLVSSKVFSAKVVNTVSMRSFTTPKSKAFDILLIFGISKSPSKRESNSVTNLDLNSPIFSISSSSVVKPKGRYSLGFSKPAIKSLLLSIILALISAA